MLTRLLRRLQGRPAPALADAASRADVATADRAHDHAEPAPASIIAPAELAAGFVRHLLGTAPDAPAVDGLADDLVDRLDALAQRLDVARLPRLPALVPQLLAVMRRDDVDANSIANLLARDPTLAGDVIRVANSAHYRRGGPISALPHAVNTIGSDGLRYVVLTTVMRPILQADPSQQAAQSGTRLAAQSEVRTWLCGTLARGQCDAGEAQLAAVIASTGVAALLRMMPRPLMAQAAADDSFGTRFLALAAELSTRAATHWRLDEALRQAVQATSDTTPATTPLARVLTRADQLSMLHALRDVGACDQATVISASAEEQRRDEQVLAALPSLADAVD